MKRKRIRSSTIFLLVTAEKREPAAARAGLKRRQRNRLVLTVVGRVARDSFRDSVRRFRSRSLRGMSRRLAEPWRPPKQRCPYERTTKVHGPPPVAGVCVRLGCCAVDATVTAWRASLSSASSGRKLPSDGDSDSQVLVLPAQEFYFYREGVNLSPTVNIAGVAAGQPSAGVKDDKHS